VKGADHPLALYRKAGVPFVLSTDDEGVSRIDLTNEYLRAVTEQGLNYADLKAAARASLEYAFLPGASLWAAPRTPVAACAGPVRPATRSWGAAARPRRNGGWSASSRRSRRGRNRFASRVASPLAGEGGLAKRGRVRGR
jgi:hypothetical protein